MQAQIRKIKQSEVTERAVPLGTKGQMGRDFKDVLFFKY